MVLPPSTNIAAKINKIAEKTKPVITPKHQLNPFLNSGCIINPLNQSMPEPLPAAKPAPKPSPSPAADPKPSARPNPAPYSSP